MATVRILHVSDLHISKYFRFAKPAGFSPGTLFDTVRNITYAAGHSNGVLSSLVRLIDQLKSSLDAVVITGDIGTTGRIFDLELALEFVAGKTGDNGILSVDGLPTISGLGVPIYLLPGNHDRYVTYYKVLGYNPGGTVFHRVFSEHWSSDVNTHRIVRGSLSVGIITADFSLRQVVDCEEPRIKNKYAQGRVYPDIMKALRQATEDFQKESLTQESIIIWAVHFPPSYPRIKPEMKLLDEQLLIKAANELGVMIILAGHTHEPLAYRGTQMNFEVLCAGTASQRNSGTGNFCHVIEIDGGVDGCWFNIENYQFEKYSAKFLRTPLPTEFP